MTATLVVVVLAATWLVLFGPAAAALVLCVGIAAVAVSARACSIAVPWLLAHGYDRYTWRAYSELRRDRGARATRRVNAYAFAAAGLMAVIEVATALYWMPRP